MRVHSRFTVSLGAALQVGATRAPTAYERSYGSFTRSFTLPEGVQVSGTDTARQGKVKA